MTDSDDRGADAPAAADDPPTVMCSRCDGEWSLEYELEELQVGNRAVERFALDHQQHTGHVPDDVSPWIVTCRQCPDGEEFLAERPARRWAQTHARHTRHAVTMRHDEELAEPTVVEPER